MDEVTNRKIVYFANTAVVTVISISFLQGIFFGLTGRWSFYNLAAIGLASASIFFGLKFYFKRSTELLARIILLYSAQFLFFVLKLIDTEPSSAPRLLEVALILLHAAAILSALISRLNPPAWPKLMLACSSVVALILICEIVLPSPVITPIKQATSGEWNAVTIPHPTLETVYRPGSTFKDYYLENPGGYFKKENSRQNQWWFRKGGNSQAEAVYSTDTPGLVRINIENTGNSTPYDIQLNLTHLRVESQHKYRVRFRGRADRPRKILVGFSRSHEPWTGLGLYQEVELKPEWGDFQIDFTATDADGNARIHFDVAQSDIPVEFSDVQLISMPDGKPIESEQKYFIEYRFNAFGCRGPDYDIPKPSGIRRILVLGDVYALGSGVNEEDTFAAKMQSALKEKYDVINCGVDEYGAQQTRLFYKFYASRYEPDLVILTLTKNANRTVLVKLNERGPLFFTWARFWKTIHPYDFSDCADEILQFNRRLSNDGSRLAVVSFRNNSDYSGSTQQGKEWNELTRTVSRELQNTKIPFLDLAKALHDKHSDRDLMVLPHVDRHPNQTAHSIASQQILSFLKEQGLL